MTPSTTSGATTAPTLARTIIITGGNTGLGYACAAALLNGPTGAHDHLVLACRDLPRAQAAAGQLRAGAARGGQVEAMVLDLASLASVRQFAHAVNTRVAAGTLPPLGAVVCNAGVQAGRELTTTKDGFETTFGVNHLGHFLLVHLLLPGLTAPARIVVVASGVHDPAQKFGLPAPAWNDVDDLAHGKLGAAAASDAAFAGGQRRYTTSKLANIYFTYALAERLPAGITAAAFDPGMMPGTGLTRQAPAPIRFLATYVLPRLIPLLRRVLNPNVHTAKESGAALARLVTDPTLQHVTGKYFAEYREVRSSPESYDKERAADLWQASLHLTGQAAGAHAG